MAPNSPPPASPTPEWNRNASRGSFLFPRMAGEGMTTGEVCLPCPYLDESGPTGVLKQGTPLGRLFLKACSINLLSEAGSILQNEPLPGSSWERGTLMK